MRAIAACAVAALLTGCAMEQERLRVRYGGGPQAQADIAACQYQAQLAGGSWGGNPFLTPVAPPIDLCMKGKGW